MCTSQSLEFSIPATSSSPKSMALVLSVSGQSSWLRSKKPGWPPHRDLCTPAALAFFPVAQASTWQVKLHFLLSTSRHPRPGHILEHLGVSPWQHLSWLISCLVDIFVWLMCLFAQHLSPRGPSMCFSSLLYPYTWYSAWYIAGAQTFVEWIEIILLADFRILFSS